MQNYGIRSFYLNINLGVLAIPAKTKRWEYCFLLSDKTGCEARWNISAYISNAPKEPHSLPFIRLL